MDLIKEQIEYASRFALKNHYQDFDKASLVAHDKLASLLNRPLSFAESQELDAVMHEIADWRSRPDYCHNLSVVAMPGAWSGYPV